MRRAAEALEIGLFAGSVDIEFAPWLRDAAKKVCWLLLVAACCLVFARGPWAHLRFDVEFLRDNRDEAASMHSTLGRYGRFSLG